jgi:microcystin-dependent protein
MAQPYIGEIRMFGGNYAPAGWEFCNGQLVAISENDALFTLIGTTYGGDGQETFGLPNLQGRVPIHQGQGPGLSSQIIGEAAGVTDVTLTTQQLAGHSHPVMATQNLGNSSNAQNRVLATGTNITMFRVIAPNVPFAATVLGPAGGSQPHTNVMPYQVVSFIISMFGIFPSQT